MEEISSGRKITELELFVLQATLLQLFETIEATEIVDDDLLLLQVKLDEARVDAVKLLTLIFKLMVVADQEGKKATSLTEQKDAKMFRRHYTRLKRLFPFI